MRSLILSANVNPAAGVFAAGKVGGGGGIAHGHVDVPSVGGGDEAGVGSGLSGVPGVGAASAELGDGLAGAGASGGDVVNGFVAKLGEAGGVVRGKDERLLRKDRKDRGVGGRDGVEEVDGGVPHGMVAMNVEKLAVGAVEAVERHFVGIDGRPAGT